MLRILQGLAFAVGVLLLVACAQPEAVPTSSPPLAAVYPPSPTPAPTKPTPTIEQRVPDNSGGRFVPLDNPELLDVHTASYLADDDLVLGYVSDGAARAYPVRMIRFHHIINDTINGRPVLVTY